MYENKQNTFLIPFLKIFELKTTHLFFFFRVFHCQFASKV